MLDSPAAYALTRRHALALGACALLPSWSRAQTPWPQRPIKLIVPFAAGGSNDSLARLLGIKLGERLGQPVIVENKGGAGGTIGTEFVAKAAPDGYTLLLASTSITTNAAAGKKLPYDPVKDLQPIGLIAQSPLVIVVSNSLKANSLRELIALARAKPGGISYGSAGTGGTNHLGTELFASAAKVQLMHVPYKGISLAFNDLMGGNLQMLVPSVPSAIGQIQGGKIRALAVTGPQRSPLAPDIPTASEAGLPGFRLEVWFGLLGPADMPASVVKRLNEELHAVLATAEVREVLARESSTPRPSTPEELGALIRTDLARWTQLIKERGIQVD
ncbi:Tripartite-type tricarboxylate transporter, receptor component TctC [Variovorax sp. YR266]|uniref:Bug family tripartite tricarboxylate transporter substrate binding protein n=1 Tax=Variovorax sp. YR266 TaxID=1884386 RepID=UPI00089A240B|nr:tripartite tricarboxylate transporter substrate binding protein [Variovorax sp. YR266]SDZ70866.1 Tripartite-type tricarboxylate transporter, receptor component TctC [Variovorax sp. YR266]